MASFFGGGAAGRDPHNDPLDKYGTAIEMLQAKYLEVALAIAEKMLEKDWNHIVHVDGRRGKTWQNEKYYKDWMRFEGFIVRMIRQQIGNVRQQSNDNKVKVN